MAALIPRNIKGVVFDMDGTLCMPEDYLFREMRQALGIAKSVDILDYVHSLPLEQQQAARRKLDEIATASLPQMEPQPGLRETIAYLTECNIKVSICTRNFPIPVHHLVNKFLKGYDVGPLITREFEPPKPAPDGIITIGKAWKLDPSAMLMVGDSLDDLVAGYKAGCATVLLKHKDNQGLETGPECSVAIDSLLGLKDLLQCTC